MRNRTGDTETCFHVRSFDASIPLDEYRALPRSGLYLILDNLRSAFNVGAIFRLGDTLRASGILLCGYTAVPPHAKLEKTSLGTLEYVPWHHFDTTLDALDWCNTREVPVWGAETTSRSVAYLHLEYPSPLALVFGNEALGIARPVLERCAQLVEIPLYGFKNSLNVAAACAVMGFHYLSATGFAARELYPAAVYRGSASAQRLVPPDNPSNTSRCT